MKSTKAKERRKDPRENIEVPVEFSVNIEAISGATKNISREGIMVTSREPIKIKIKINGKEWKGTLIRIQPIDNNLWGYAIKFDSPLPIEELKS